MLALPSGFTGVEYHLNVAAVRCGSDELTVRAGEKAREGEEEDLGKERNGRLIAAAFRSKDR